MTALRRAVFGLGILVMLASNAITYVPQDPPPTISASDKDFLIGLAIFVAAFFIPKSIKKSNP
jgi:hypothetical protein